VNKILLILISVLIGAMNVKSEELEKHFSKVEINILTEVSAEYGLTEQETTILFSIRRVENGGPGLEMGVGQDYPKHPARRYATNFGKSLRLQAQWAAGTIKKRYDGDLLSFAKQYCAKPQEWFDMMTSWISKLSDEKES
jgi:hypothetical protein